RAPGCRMGRWRGGADAQRHRKWRRRADGQLGAAREAAAPVCTLPRTIALCGRAGGYTSAVQPGGRPYLRTRPTCRGTLRCAVDVAGIDPSDASDGRATPAASFRGVRRPDPRLVTGLRSLTR